MMNNRVCDAESSRSPISPRLAKSTPAFCQQPSASFNYEVFRQRIVLAMSSTVPTAEDVKPPSPPFITVSGIQNFRDIGGYPVSTSSNHSVRNKVLYRCADPSKITEEGIVVAQELGITHVYDLRSNNEIERNKASGIGGVVEWEGCERVFAPVFEDTDYSPEALASRFKDYAAGGPEVSTFVTHVTRRFGDIK